jgi:hypothetical protein
MRAPIMRWHDGVPLGTPVRTQVGWYRDAGT